MRSEPTLRWSKYRGPGTVAFDKPRPDIEKIDAGEGAFNGKATTNVKFSEPGDYVLRVLASDGSAFSAQCCWTNGYVRVQVGGRAR